MVIDRNYRMKETSERLHARGFDVNFFASKKKNNKIKKLGTWTLNIKSNATTSCAIFWVRNVICIEIRAAGCQLRCSEGLTWILKHVCIIFPDPAEKLRKNFQERFRLVFLIVVQYDAFPIKFEWESHLTGGS